MKGAEGADCLGVGGVEGVGERGWVGKFLWDGERSELGSGNARSVCSIVSQSICRPPFLPGIMFINFCQHDSP